LKRERLYFTDSKIETEVENVVSYDGFVRQLQIFYKTIMRIIFLFINHLRLLAKFIKVDGYRARPSEKVL